jgi:hypothetical protein
MSQFTKTEKYYMAILGLMFIVMIVLGQIVSCGIAREIKVDVSDMELCVSACENTQPLTCKLNMPINPKSEQYKPGCITGCVLADDIGVYTACASKARTCQQLAECILKDGK